MQLSVLDEEYAKAVQLAESDYKWYWKNRLTYIALSWLLRGGAVACLAIGFLLPILHPDSRVSFLGIEAASGPQAAIAALLIAGLFVGINQVFMITSTWSRYALAMLRIRTLLRLVEWDWKNLRSGFVNDVDADGVKKAFDLFKSLVAESSKVVETEATTWSSDLAKAVDNLAALIKEQRGAMDAQVKELQQLQRDANQIRAEQERSAEAARKANIPGAVKLKFEGAVSRLQGQVKATLSGVEQLSDAKALSFAFSRVEPGLKDLTLSFQDSNANIINLRTVVEVVSGKVSESTIAIPSA